MQHGGCTGRSSLDRSPEAAFMDSPERTVKIESAGAAFTLLDLLVKRNP